MKKFNKTKFVSRLADNSVKDGKMTSDPNEIAEHFNEYFINLAGPNLAVKRPTSLRNFDSYLGESYLNSIFLKAITIIKKTK